MRAGYSMVEALAIISIVVILAVGIFIYIGFYRGIKLEAAAEKLAADLRYAQNQAMNYTLWYGVSFEVDPANKYYVYQTNGSADTLIADPAKFGSNLMVDLNERFEVKIDSVDLEGDANKVEFNGLGRPFTDYYGWQVSEEGTIILSLDGRTKTLTLTPGTGRVTIQ